MHNEVFIYLQSAALVTLIALITRLLFFTPIRKEKAFAPFRRARIFLTLMYAMLSANLLLSIVFIKIGILNDYSNTILDLMFNTPMGSCILWFSGNLLQKDYDFRKNLRRDIGLYIFLSISIICASLSHEPVGHNIPFMLIVTCWVGFVLTYVVRVVLICFQAMRANDSATDHMSVSADRLNTTILSFIAWGIFCPMAALLPISFNTIYLVVGIVIMVFLYTSFFFHLKTFSTDTYVTSGADFELTPDEIHNVTWQLREWNNRKGYRTPGVTAESTARELGVDPGLLCHIISTNYRCSFADHISRLRVRDAQEVLVRFPTLPVADVASMLGFVNADDLESKFLKITNMRPKEWRDGLLSIKGNKI